MHRWISLALRACFVAVFLVAPGRGGRLARADANPDPTPLPRVVVRGFGPVDNPVLATTCRTLTERYPVRCEVRAEHSMLDALDAWDAERVQLDARRVLEHAFRIRTNDALVELWVTALDMYDERKPFVFGLASVTDRVAIVSLSRIVDPANPSVTERRLNKLVLHEVGHTIGLPHHAESSCVMRQDASPPSLDSAPEDLCVQCQAILTERAEALARPGQIELDRTRGHLVRREIEEARLRAVRALWEFSTDPVLANGFAVAFMEARRWNEAVGLLAFALEKHPQYAEAHLNRAIALQMRNETDDLATAIEHYERAARLRPEWTDVAEHTRELRLQTTRAQAQGPAR